MNKKTPIDGKGNLYKRYCPETEERGQEWYQSIGLAFLHNRRCFLGTPKGLLWRIKFEKTGFSFYLPKIFIKCGSATKNSGA
jgi:hypothetical protein